MYESVSDILNINKKLKNYEEKMMKLTGEKLNELVIKYSNLQEKFINMLLDIPKKKKRCIK